MVEAAAQVQQRDSQALVRLPIDRVFTIKGFGTVVTGTLVAGTIRREEELEVFPSSLRARVRGIQVHGQAADAVTAGQRTALNLAGVSTEDLSRGMTLAPVATLASTRRLDVSMRLLSSAPRPLKARTRVHFHSNTMETVAEVAFHSVKQLHPGEEVFARLKLPSPALLLPGDRFIIRQFSPVLTVGGGVVLDAAPIGRFKQVHAEPLLKVFITGNPEAALVARVARRGNRGLTLGHAVAETGWRRERIESCLDAKLKSGLILKFGDLLLDSGTMLEMGTAMPQLLAEFHKKNPLTPGIGREALRERLNLQTEVFAAVLDSLVREKKVHVDADLVRLPGHGVVMKGEEAESKKKIEEAFSAAGLRVPALHEVLAGLKVDKARAQKIVTLLLRERILLKISDELVFHRSALEELRRLIVGQKSKAPRMDVAMFKELTGVSRKYAIPLLEYLDRERVTRRVGDVREIL
jgi:selenocysteine-specific elongation factor